jgi:hypothetical protein
MGECPQSAMNTDPDCAGRLSDDPRDDRHIEAGDYSEHHHLGLFGRQRSDQREGPLGRDPLEGIDVGRRRRRVPADVVDIGDEDGRPGGRCTSGIDRTMARDGEHPGSEPVGIADEAREVSNDLQPGLGGNIFIRRPTANA